MSATLPAPHPGAAADLSAPLLIPAWTLIYNGRDVTSTLLTAWTEIRYTEQIGGKANELEMRFADPAQIMQHGPPTPGGSIQLTIGYAGGWQYPCGSFQADEYDLTGPPDIFTVRAVQTGVTPAIRTLNSVAYEGQTLLSIAQTVASKHGFTVVGDAVNPDVPYARMTQNLESDIAFLHRIANEHGYDFNIRGSQLIFFSRAAIESAPSSGTISRDNLVHRFSFRNQLLGSRVFKGATVKYFNVDEKGVETGSATASNVTSGDTLKATERVENSQQAQVRAQGYLHAHNMNGIKGELDVVGTMAYRAGNPLHVSGFGIFDQAAFTIERAVHKLDHSGYMTKLYLRTNISASGKKAVPQLKTFPVPDETSGIPQ